MGLLDETYSTAQFAERIGATPDNVHDWRRRGIDFGHGVAINGRKKFSDFDLFEWHLWMHLRKLRYDDLRDAFQKMRHLAPMLAHRMGLPYGGRARGGQMKNGRFAFIGPTGKVAFSDNRGGWGEVFGNDQFAGEADCFDLDMIAVSLLHRIKVDLGEYLTD